MSNTQIEQLAKAETPQTLYDVVSRIWSQDTSWFAEPLNVASYHRWLQRYGE